MFRVEPASERATERRQEQLPFPKFFQEECMSACLPARSPYFQQLPPLSRGEARGDPVLYDGRGCGHQLAGCPIKGSITCFVWNYKQKQESRRNQKHHPARAPSMDGQDRPEPGQRRRRRRRRRRREEKCENRKNYVLRTGCPVSNGFRIWYTQHKYIACRVVVVVLAGQPASQPFL